MRAFLHIVSAAFIKLAQVCIQFTPFTKLIVIGIKRRFLCCFVAREAFIMASRRRSLNHRTRNMTVSDLNGTNLPVYLLFTEQLSDVCLSVPLSISLLLSLPLSISLSLSLSRSRSLPLSMSNNFGADMYNLL